MEMKKEMSKEDWIILRLVIVAIHYNPVKARASAEVFRSIMHIEKTYGRKYMNKCIDILLEERLK